MESVFSVRPLEALLAAGHDVRFVMRPMGGLPTRTRTVLRRHRGFDFNWRRALGIARMSPDDEKKRNPLALAADADIPAYIVGNASAPAALQLFEREKLDLIVIAFFNQLLTTDALAIPRLGAVNIHPSLLPTYRGPSPLFWTFRDGCEETGLTVHRVSRGEDEGDILLQERVPLPLGTRGEDLVDDLAERGARLVALGVAGVEAGTLEGHRQDASKATRAPRPTPDDLLLDASLEAKRVFHFVRGVGRWNPLIVDVGAQRLRVIDAFDFHQDRALPGELLLQGDTLLLGCADGSVALQVRAIAPSP
jgi:methionyl-tRNA formyltransferase